MPPDRTATDSLWAPEEAEVAPTLIVAHHPEHRWVGVRRILRPGEHLELARGGQALGGGILDDDRISDRHCALSRRGGTVTVRDLGSHNGTWVDGQIVSEATLADGAVLALGRLVLVYRDAPLEWSVSSLPGLIATSPAMATVVETIDQIAAMSSSVLIRGETGVGKELVARALHARSERPGPFVAVNCGALQDAVLQSELFGHARGAFTGAERSRAGLVAQASDGTLLLDEIGAASASLQAALLRVLQEREVRPVGENEARPVGTRFVAATHGDLAAAVEEGRFRGDLFNRLARWEIEVPPLRSRIADIPLIARAVARDVVGHPIRLHHRLAHALMLRPWPGNVRELQTVIERLAVRQGAVRQLRLPSGWDPPGKVAAQPPGTPMERPDPDQMRARLVALGGNVRRYARELGVGRSTLYRWLGEAGIDVASTRGDPGGNAA